MTKVRTVKTPCLGFSDRLKAVRKANGVTQEKFAEDMNCSLGTVKKWETYSGGSSYGAANSGKKWTEPDLYTLKEIATRFHVTTDYLLGKDDEEYRPLRDVAQALGISQMAVKKLEEIASEYDEGKNLPLNGLILGETFSLVLQKMTALYYASGVLRENPLGYETDAQNEVLRTTLSGFAYVDYLREDLLKYFDALIRHITGYNDAKEAYYAATVQQIKRQLFEKEEE